ncbi:MAG: class I tRNA ligase family protein, partial [Candidatus Omnitrophota bacterium]|nr:class I tRNA ligase family protein [Candidatus Omnitrophota bacterium]
DKYFGGKVPKRRKISSCDELTKPIIDKVGRLPQDMTSAMDKIDFSKALSVIWELVGLSNKFIEQKAPWKLSKENKSDELKDMMYDLFEVLRIVSVALSPFLPATSDEMANQLGLDPKKKRSLKDLSWGKAKSGTKVIKGKPLFPRIEK